MLRRYYEFKPFTEGEAWLLFKLAAFGEALGWTILITGILLGHFLKSNLPVLIAGQFHGILFLLYFAAVILVSPSMSWKFNRIAAAIICGAPPYGSLLFEIWQSHHKSRVRLKVIIHNLYLRQLEIAD